MKVALLGVRHNGGDGEEGHLLLLGGDWLLKIKGKKTQHNRLTRYDMRNIIK